MRSFLLLSVVVLLAGCSAVGGQDTLQTDPPETLAEARARWQQRGFSAYRLHYARLCFCAPRRLEATVTVRAGAVVAFDDLRGDGQPLDAEERDITVDYFLSVEQLFDAIAAAEPEFREVTYDAARGYPVEARLGEFARDAGTEYVLSNLEPLR